MARLVLLLAAGVNLTTLMSALMVWDVLSATTVWLLISMVPALVTTAVLIVVAVRAGQSGHRLRTGAEAGQPQPGITDRDDDAHWIGGLIYINRDDPALWVPKRFGGIGWTVNLGRPAGVVMVAAVVALAVGVPIWAAAAA
jgi:uncharacterized membrane protein